MSGENAGVAPPWLRAFVFLVREVGFPVVVCAFLLWELGPKVDRLIEAQRAATAAIERLVQSGCVRGGGCRVVPLDLWRRLTASGAGAVAGRDVEARVGRSCRVAASSAFRDLGARCVE